MRLGNGLVHLLVFFDPSKEISHRFFPRGILIVGVARTDLESNIGSDDRRVVTDRFEKDHNEAFFFGYSCFNLSSEYIDMSLRDFLLESETCRRSRVLLVASRSPLVASYSVDRKDLPCMPTFPPSFSHWINISKLSVASCSRNRVASRLEWLKYEAV
jgi:hypothetical protein